MIRRIAHLSAIALVAATVASCSSGESAPEATASSAAVSEGTKGGYDRHVNGVSLEVFKVERREKSLAVEVKAVNGNTQAVDINNIGMFLIDQDDNIYKFAPPEQNKRLQVPSGSMLTGTLVFLGDTSKGATTVTLRTGVQERKALQPMDLGERSTVQSSPAFQIEDLEVQS